MTNLNKKRDKREQAEERGSQALEGRGTRNPIDPLRHSRHCLSGIYLPLNESPFTT
jgi:hypothetical protein